MNNKEQRYYKYSRYLREKYGEKVYKISINLPLTCPNRDGSVGTGGCTFCGDEGAGFEKLDLGTPVKEQLAINREAVAKKYNAKKFIAYFQNYTNTYLPLKQFKEVMRDVCESNVVEIAISTRPDCVNNKYLDFLEELSQEHNINISIEMGLQTVNYHTLTNVNRGHTLAEFIDAALACRQRGFSTCAHLILNLPGDNLLDTVETAKLMSALRITQVKLHSLYIVKGTPLEEAYNRGDLKLISRHEYIERVITFLEYLDPQIAVQRLVGRAPEESTVFSNWSTSGWKIISLIEQELFQRDTYQGKKCNYLNGAGLKWKD
ncbi:TIGR01212 family radical SAM protein [Desulfitispora alkaliphila]|uniref:TIGR01212 family radical SAM protein n=1 Tax=Desulfitispora alkaliphila TaxID=622674 RepID=UPI003D1DD649